MLFEGRAVEPVNAAELSWVNPPTAARQRQAVTMSLRIGLRAERRDRLLPPDPAQHCEHQHQRHQTDEGATHFASVCVEQDVARDRHAERDAADLAGKANRPGVAPRIRIALRAICEPAGRLKDVDDAVRDEATLHVWIGEGDHVAGSYVACRDRAVEREAPDW